MESGETSQNLQHRQHHLLKGSAHPSLPTLPRKAGGRRLPKSHGEGVPEQDLNPQLPDSKISPSPPCHLRSGRERPNWGGGEALFLALGRGEQMERLTGSSWVVLCLKQGHAMYLGAGRGQEVWFPAPTSALGS